MVKALQIAVAVCNVQGNQLLMIVAVGDDGFAYQFVNGKWDRFPALDAEVIQGGITKIN